MYPRLRPLQRGQTKPFGQRCAVRCSPHRTSSPKRERNSLTVMMDFRFNRLGFFISDIISSFVRLFKLDIHLRVYVGLVFRLGGVNNESASLRSPQTPTSGSSQPSPIRPSDAASNLAKAQSPDASGAGPVSTPKSAVVAAIQPGGGVNNEGASLRSPQTPASGSSQPSPITPSDAASNLASVQSLAASGAGPVSTPRSPAVAAIQPASIPTVQQSIVEFWSRPDGADIELDGNYIGSTPSTILVPVGEHTVTIRKQDFRTWQETFQVTSRNVRVAADMERVSVTVHFNH